MAFNTEYPYLDKLSSVDEYQQVFHPQGYLYSAFGGYPIGIPKIECYKVVLVVRDPRDVLTSRYFAKKTRRGLPPRAGTDREDFVRERKRARSMSIDDFALANTEELRKTYQRYMDALLQEHPNVYVTRYEDMTADVEQWLDDLLSYVELPAPRHVRTEIVEEARAIQGKKEDESSHYRKGVPGDHREKLRPKTVEKLTAIFEDVLERFGYTK